MKNIGKIINYNGSNGLIIDKNGEKYILSKNNLLYSDPRNGDIVTFKVEKFKTIEIEKNIATFVQRFNINEK